MLGDPSETVLTILNVAVPVCVLLERPPARTFEEEMEPQPKAGSPTHQ